VPELEGNMKTDLKEIRWEDMDWIYLAVKYTTNQEICGVNTRYNTNNTRTVAGSYKRDNGISGLYIAGNFLIT
jgi:hypothetical protein